ncbi:MAG: hypothetical protein U9R42_03170 [Bacteroidota bacterium]|nr:hypothetical protein [Bacteroidota bacterium]
MTKRFLIILQIVFLIIVSEGTVMSQGFHTKFGKSKVQYEQFDWYFYRTKTFEVYYHQGGKNLAHYVLTYGKKYLEEIERAIDYRIGDQLTIVIYNTYSDYKQSNITLVDEQYNTGGHTPIIDNIAFVYFDGNHYEFDKRIKAAITEVLLNELMYGNTVQQRLQNSTLMSLPEWFYNGTISYFSNDWDYRKEAILQQGILSKKFKKFGRLSKSEKMIFGHSLWSYISKIYGKKAIPDLLYMTHINKNMDAGFKFVLGKGFDQIYENWYRYNSYKYLSKENDEFQEIKNNIFIKRLGKNSEITRIKLGPNGDKIAYVSNKKGKTKVYVYDITTGKKRKIFKQGYLKDNAHEDKNYPVITWHPRAEKIAIIYDKKSIPNLFEYNLKKKKKENKKKLDRLDKVLDFSYNNRGESIVLSAIRNGSSDIFIFQMRSNRLFTITNDIFDDLHPQYINNSEGIVFSSNRTDYQIKRRFIDPTKKFMPTNDIFYYDIKNKSKKLRRITFTNNINEVYPNEYDSSFISYLTFENGIINRDAAYPDSIFNHIEVLVKYVDTTKFKNDTFKFYENNTSIINYSTKTYFDTIIEQPKLPDSIFIDSNQIVIDTTFEKRNAQISSIDTFFVYHDTSYIYPQTNYPNDIVAYDVKARAFSILELFYENGKYKLSTIPIPRDLRKIKINRIEKNKIFKELKVIKRNQEMFDYIETPDEQTITKDKNTEIVEIKNDSFSYFFLNDFDAIKVDTSDDVINHDFFKKTKIISNKFNKEKQKYTRTRFGSSSMYFMSLTPDYLVSQLDNSYLQTPYFPYDKNTPITPFNKAINTFIMLGVSDLFHDYKLSGGFRIKSNLNGSEYLVNFENLKKRLDKKIVLYRNAETSGTSYLQSKQITHEGRLRLSYPFSEISTLKGDVFLRQDRKVTLSSEHSSLVEPDVISSFIGYKFEYIFDNTRNLTNNILQGTRFKVYFENYREVETLKNVLSVYGTDFRNYIKIHKQIIWANRFAFASSVGDSKISFFLGGVDNWLFPKVDEDIQVDPDLNYVFRSLAVNLRGFSQNIRNGNSYALINSELRIPIFRYLYNRPLKSNFFDKFQIVAFADAGTAWIGLHPYSEENSLNKRIIKKNPFEITVITIGEPIVAGYGFGARTELFGYFIKFDYAWGIEGNEILGNMKYLSFGLDF